MYVPRLPTIGERIPQAIWRLLIDRVTPPKQPPRQKAPHGAKKKRKFRQY